MFDKELRKLAGPENLISIEVFNTKIQMKMDIIKIKNKFFAQN